MQSCRAEQQCMLSLYLVKIAEMSMSDFTRQSRVSKRHDGLLKVNVQPYTRLFSVCVLLESLMLVTAE